MLTVVVAQQQKSTFMSKGYGAVQLKMLALLDNHHVKRHSDKAATYSTIRDLAESVVPSCPFSSDVMHSQWI